MQPTCYNNIEDENFDGEQNVATITSFFKLTFNFKLNLINFNLTTCAKDYTDKKKNTLCRVVFSRKALASPKFCLN